MSAPALSPAAAPRLRGPWPPLRDATPHDLPALQAFMRGLSVATRAQRFHAPLHELPPLLTGALARRDPAHRFVVADAGGELLALGQYAADPDAAQCELALVVADAWQSRGLGRRLLERLLAQAAASGLRRAVIETARRNAAMQHLARACGFVLRRHPDEADMMLGERAL